MTPESKTTPWAHQEKELKLWESEARALLWQMRTGKTKVIIDTLGGWFKHKGLKSAIIVAPNGVHENWVSQEFPKHAAYEHCAHAWYTRKAKTKVYRQTFDAVLNTSKLCVLAVGKEALLSDITKKAINRLLKRGPCALIVDESHHFGHAGTIRTRKIRGLAKKCVCRRILSGTPTGNSPLRLFSQFEILRTGALGYTRYDNFEQQYAICNVELNKRTGSRYKQIVGYKNLPELQTKIAEFSSVVLRKDCEDLPPLVISRQYYEMSPIQSKAYEQLRLEMIAELESGAIVEATDAGVRLIRLQQILSNFCLTDQLEIEAIDSDKNPRLDALIESIDGPAIVWCRFREDIRQVTKRLKAEKISFVEYHGSVSQQNRQIALEKFRNGGVQIFVGQPSCAGEGIDLTAAQTIIWYSHVFDVVTRDQASERATKIGGKSVSIVDLAVAKSVDEYILYNLSQKQSIADSLTGQKLKEVLTGHGV